jgi:hypothetical protein
MATRRSIMYMVSFVAAAVAAAIAAHVSASWTWSTAAFVVVVALGALATGFAEASGRRSAKGVMGTTTSITAKGRGSVAIGGDNHGSIVTGARGDDEEDEQT